MKELKKGLVDHKKNNKSKQTADDNNVVARDGSGSSNIERKERKTKEKKPSNGELVADQEQQPGKIK